MALFLIHTDRGIFQMFAPTATAAKADLKVLLGSDIKFTKASERVSERAIFSGDVSNLTGIILPPKGVPMGCARLTGQNVEARRAEFSFANFVIPEAARAVEWSYAEMLIPESVDRRVDMSFSQFSIPDAASRAAMSYAALTLPDAPISGNVLRPTYTPGNNTANQTALRGAINSAQPGDTILLPEGSYWWGNYSLPQKANIAQYITIRTDIPLSEMPPPGTRLSPSYYPRMARIGNGTGLVDTFVTAVASNPAVQYWKFQFVEILPPDITLGGWTRACVSLGQNDTTQTTLDVQPHHFIFDRCWVHGDEFRGVHRAFYMNCGMLEIKDSVCDMVKTVQPDGQVIGGVSGSGPMYVTNTELAGGTECFIFGGDSTKIPFVNFTDIQFHACYMRNYPALRGAAAVPAMGTVTLSEVAGGTLAAGTHTFRVSGRASIAGGNSNGARSAEVSIVLGAPGSVRLNWTPLSPTNRISYRVWKLNADGTWKYVSVAEGSSTYTATVETGWTAGSTPPGGGTVWAIKNLWETKAGINIVVNGCLLEHMWLQGQTGMAFSVKLADYRSCAECKTRSENITLKNCVARHMNHPAVFVTAEGPAMADSNYVLKNVRLENILFYDTNNSYGSNNYAMTAGGSVRPQFRTGMQGLHIDHCTFIHFGVESGGADRPGGQGMIKFYDYRSDTGLYDTIIPFSFVNNLIMRGEYGFFGSNSSAGNDTLNKYCPGGIVRRNVIAGASPSSYPSDNDYPTQADFQTHFKTWRARDPNDEGNYALKPTSKYATTYLGTDNKPIGADIALIKANMSPTDLPRVANLF
jgi:hypothetical protein